VDKYRTLLRKHSKKLLNFDNVVGVGVGYKIVNGRSTNEPSIMVLVKKKLPKETLKKRDIIPKTLGQISTDVIEVGEIKLLALRTEKARPARPGMSIGHYKVTAGTFGALVNDARTGEPLILSNNHVLANATDGNDGKSAIGDPILQPGVYDGGTEADVIAHLERFVPIKKSMSQPQCRIARGAEGFLNRVLGIIRPEYKINFIKKNTSHNLIDAAVAKPVKPDYIVGDIFELGRTKAVTQPKIGMNVKKSGRTSGITANQINALDVMLNVMIGPMENAVFHEQVLAGPMAQPGDSGSIVVNDDMDVVGLLFAGSDQASIINPIANVLKLLRVTF
jgi:hypothetical protein